MNAETFVEELLAMDGADFIYTPKENTRIGVRMKDVFDLAKKYKELPLDEVERLLQHEIHEARVGAVSILDFIGRDKKITDDTRKKIYDVYMDNHDYINTWDLVDRAAPYVVGGYLYDRSRQPLYELAKSQNPMERRTAIVATYYFIRQDDIDDTFAIARMLAADPDEYVQMAIGSWIREAGKRDKTRLLLFLKDHNGRLSQKSIRYATEKLSQDEKDYITSN